MTAGLARSRPLHRDLIVLALAAILPLTVLTGVGLAQIYRQQRDEAQRRALEITRAMAIAVDLELDRSLAAIGTLATSASLRRGDLETFGDILRRTAAAQPRWLNIIVADPQGRPLLNALAAPGEPLPGILDPASLAAAVDAHEPRVGNLVQGLRRWAFAVRAPVIEDDGRVLYVLSAVVDPAAVRDILQRQSVPDDWTVSVFDGRGARVARNRAHERFIGGPAADSLRRLMDSGGPEGTGITQVLDSGEAFSAYSRLPRSGWSVALAIPVDSVSAAGRRTVEVYGAAVLVSLVAGLAAVLAVARRINEPMRRLREGARRIGEDADFTAVPSGIREIDEVADALARSVAQRRAYAAERERFLEGEREARTAAEEANRAKDRFLAMLAHELRNPLAALSNAAALMRRAGSDPRVSQRASDVVQRQVNHLARLTDDLLDAARALLGKTSLRLEPLDLGAAMAEVLATLQATGRTAEHAVQADLRPAWILGDPVRIDQVATNLVVNAVKYTPIGGTLRISTGREGADAVLRVADDGMGMSPELAARAFDLFVQGERALDRAPGGLGIGLTLVRRLAELHGGSAVVESAGEGRGSTFTVRIPAIDPPAGGDEAQAPGGTVPRHVLIAEDNDDARETLRELLELAGHRVRAVRAGPDAIEAALEFPPDVVLLDLALPGLDGFEIARRLRERFGARILLVAMTGFGADADRERTAAAGFDAHLTKPVSAEALAALLRDTR